MSRGCVVSGRDRGGRRRRCRRRAASCARRRGRRRGGGRWRLVGKAAERALTAEEGEHVGHPGCLHLGDEDRVPRDRRARRGDLVGRDAVGIDGTEHTGELEQLARRQLVVGHDVVARRADQATGHAWVECPAVEHLGEHAPHEVLLPRDATEIEALVHLPAVDRIAVVGQVLVVAAAHIGEGVITIELEAAGLGHVEAGVGVARWAC